MRPNPLTAIAMLSLAACSSADFTTAPSAGSGPTTARAPVARPLSGTCTTVVSRLVPPPVEVQHIEYTCRISHLGLTRAILTQQVDVATGALSSNGTFVAATGDQLTASFTGTAVLSFTDPTEATVTFQGTQHLSAGTGRFADATGTADLAGTAAINLITGAGTGEFTLEGTLQY
jgi:hypothetical protein